MRSGVTYLRETAPLGRLVCAVAMVLARTAEVLRAAALAVPDPDPAFVLSKTSETK